MKTTFDKNKFLSLSNKISKKKNLNKSYINQNNLKILYNSNTIDSDIIAKKERSQSVKLITSSSSIFDKKKENEKENKRLISEKEINKNNTEFSISSNISSDSTYNELIQEKKVLNKKKTQQKRINYFPSEKIKLIKKDYGVHSIKKYLFLKKNSRNENKENINLNSNENKTKNLRIKTINSSPINNNNTLIEIYLNNKNNNINNKKNIKEKINKNDNGNSLFTRITSIYNSNSSNTSYYSSKSLRENNIFRRNNNFKCYNSSNSPLNTFHQKILFQTLNSSYNFSKKSNNISLINNINYNNNIPYKIESYFNKKNSILEKIEKINTNNNILYNSNFIKMKISNNNIQNTIQNKIENIIIELEDLLILEEKLFDILTSIKDKKTQYKYCIEWWNYYEYISFGGKFELCFKKNENKMTFDIAHETTNLELFSIILVYDVLKNSNLNQCNLFLLENLINEVHQNFLIVCDYILYMIKENFPKDNFWFCKLKEIILCKLNHSINSNEHIILLKKGNCTINLLIETILNQFENEKKEKITNSNLKFYFNKISEMNINNLNKYFQNKIHQHFNYKERILNFNKNNANLEIPYLNKKILNDKKFTLILDLDDILINMKYDKLGRGILKFRPNLFFFLNEANKIFEIIIFTVENKEYVDTIIKIIEKDKKYFNKILYREHTTLIKDIFVKDLSKLGRDLSKVIIIDNLPQRFKLQKENGILVKTFNGENKNDCKLKKLIPILKKATSDNNNDVRIELMNMKKEIISKISTELEN